MCGSCYHFFLPEKIFGNLSNFYFYLSNKNRIIPTLKRERVSVTQIKIEDVKNHAIIKGNIEKKTMNKNIHSQYEVISKIVKRNMRQTFQC